MGNNVRYKGDYSSPSGKVWKGLAICFLFLIALIIAVATFVEDKYGTAYAHQHIYGSWWFIALWGLLALTGCWLLYKKKTWKRLPVFLLHLSFLIILAGALTTHLSSRRGMIHLREGEATRSYWVKDEQGAYTTTEDMPFFLALHDFQVLYDADGVSPSDYVSKVIIATRDGEEEKTVSMNNIGRAKGYRIYQTSFDEDEGGSVFTVSYDPWGTAITYAGYLLLVLSMIGVSVRKVGGEKRVERGERNVLDSLNSTQEEEASSLHSPLSTLHHKSTLHQKKSPLLGGVGGWLLFFCGTAMASYMVISICRSPLVPVLRSPFLFVHVGTIMISYILLVVSIARRELLRPAVFLLATGIFLGAVWANVSWGTYWSWDPKESWALVTLLLYSLPLHEKDLPWFRSQRNYRIYSVFALLVLLMTYFGVNYLLGGMHSYA